MAKRCSVCGYVSQDDLPLCMNCGEPFDSELKMIRQIGNSITTQKAPERRPTRDNDDDFVHTPMADQEKKGSALPWVILGLAVVAVLVWFFFLR